jgi:hypothetical protein
MKYSAKLLAGTVGIVALGWIVPVIAQQAGTPGIAPSQPRTFNPNPGVSIPPAAPAAAPAFGGPSTLPGSGSRQAQRGVVLVPHGLVTAIDDVKVAARDAGTLTHIAVKG